MGRFRGGIRHAEPYRWVSAAGEPPMGTRTLRPRPPKAVGRALVALQLAALVWPGPARATAVSPPVGCPTASPLSGSGGWQGGGAFPCDGGFEAGRLLVSFAGDNFWSLWNYLDGSDNYPGPGLPPPQLDFELRASGSRPLAALLTGARDYLEAVRANDPLADCRPYAVLLLTDGGESCTGDAASVASILYGEGVPAYALGFGVASCAARDELDDVAAAGGAVAADFVEEGAALSEALDRIADGLRNDGVRLELCHGVDDDCDDLVDEDFFDLGQACDNGLLGVCRREGFRRCSLSGMESECAVAGAPVPPSEEDCNDLDDDCDGFVDEGGVCGVPESCNGLDDDGDGQIDEDYSVGALCHDAGIGSCRGTGVFQCQADGSGVVCSVTEPGSPPAAADTACDGEDEDCDGLLDEDAIGEVVAVGWFAIDRHEASRPDATSTDEGQMEHRACSKPGALPWRGLSWTQAAASCAAAGKRLCSSEEWQTACEGAAQLVYPYGNTYQAAACNGRDFIAGDDRLLPTGSAPGCVTPVGVVDLSGNLAEWTSTLGSSVPERVVRGGAFDSYAPGLTCRFETDEEEEVALPTLGFRCCTDIP